MVVRAGAIRGPLRKTDWAGIVAGCLLPVVLFVFTVWAGAKTPGYSHVRDTISELGTRGAHLGWFRAVSFVDAGLVLLFVFVAHRRLPVGPSVVSALLLLVSPTALVGVFPCTMEGSGADAHCSSSDAHAVSGLLVMLAILAYQGFAWRTARARGWDWFRTLSGATFGLSVALFVAVVVTNTNQDGDVAGLFERLYWAVGYAWVVVAAFAMSRTGRAPVPRTVANPGLQRKILDTDRWTHGTFTLFRIRDVSGTRRWLEALHEGMTSDRWGKEGNPAVTVAFTHAGLGRLSSDYATSRVHDEAFAEGMAARAERHLGDRGPAAPTGWDWPTRPDDVDGLVWIYANGKASLDDAKGHVLDGWRDTAIEVLDEQSTAQVRPGEKPVEHFGFRDGISQPWVDGTRDEPKPSEQGALTPWKTWRPIARGEFVLGEVDESDDIPPLPEPRSVFEHGSYLVVRKLAQNVDAWHRFTKDEARRLGAEPDEVGALIVGRRRDGRPVWTPEGPDAANDFTFADDPNGLQCPLGAHIRRANPRASGAFADAITNRHRMIRRGMPYPSDGDGEWSRGLMFVAVVARIADQFEFVQWAWLNDGDRQGLGRDRDPIGGSGDTETKVVLARPEGTHVTGPVPELVRTRGGGYFFAPSLAGLAALAQEPAGR
jgi:Dyp-type peroxidase family